MNNKNIKILIVMVSLFLFYSLWNKSSEKYNSDNNSKIQDENESGNSRSNPIRVNKKSMTKKKIAVSRKIMKIESNLHIRRVPLETSNKGIHMSVLVKPIETLGCSLGDLDIIEKDLKKNSISTLIFSVETLREKPLTIQRKTSINELKKGFSHNFLLPFSNQNELFGVFLCSGKGSCQKKTAANMSKLSRLQRGAGKGFYPTSSKIYQFQSFFLGKNHIKWLSPGKTRGKQIGKINKILKASGIKKDIRKPLRLIDKLNNTIESQPMRYQNSQITISMPHLTTICKKLFAKEHR